MDLKSDLLSGLVMFLIVFVLHTFFALSEGLFWISGLMLIWAFIYCTIMRITTENFSLKGFFIVTFFSASVFMAIYKLVNCNLLPINMISVSHSILAGVVFYFLSHILPNKNDDKGKNQKSEPIRKEDEEKGIGILEASDILVKNHKRELIQQLTREINELKEELRGIKTNSDLDLFLLDTVSEAELKRNLKRYDELTRQIENKEEEIRELERD